MSSATNERQTGSRVVRPEDVRLLSGRGNFIDDANRPGMLHAHFVRSNHAHARLLHIDTTLARRHPGVHAVLTDGDLRNHIGDMTATGAPGLFVAIYSALARDTVRCVGEPIAVVIADSRAIAEDAGALISIDYQVLEAVVDMDQAMSASAPVLFADRSSNVIYRSEHHYGNTEAAFARAAHVVRERFVQHRVSNAPLECRGGLAEFSSATGELRYTTAHQSPHLLRVSLATLLRLAVHKVRVLCGDIGGSFGQKGGIGREDVALCAAARLLGCSVKWVEDRSENLMIAGQAREERLDVEAGIAADGRLLALRVRMVIDTGAYPHLGFPASSYPNVVRSLLPGGYRLEHYDFEAVGVATNKAAYVPFRGASAVETWVRERLFDVLARTVSLDPVEFRLRNLLQAKELPRTSAAGVELSTVSQRETMRQLVEHVGYESFRREQEAARAHGRYLGIGFANFMEPAPFTPSLVRAIGSAHAPRTAQEAHLRLEPDGSLTLFTSQQPQGQGHETTLAQLVADQVGVGLEQVRVVHGDTTVTPFNFVGTGGSGSATLASGAVLGAARNGRDRILQLAANVWELDARDLDIVAGQVIAKNVAGRSMPMSMIGQLAYTRPGLAATDGLLGIDERYAYISGEGTFSQATHCAIVEVDVETGHVRILRFVVMQDCGEMINPAVVEGQVRGGVAQGIGAVLFEQAAYAADGSLLADSFADYLLPTANDLPHIEVLHVANETDDDVPFRGVGQGGAIGAPAALTNAIEDALVPFGAKIREQYLPPYRLLELCGLI